MEEALTIIGIDPGTRITGYGVLRLQGSRILVLDYGCIRPPTKAPLPTRYACIFDALELLLTKHTPHAVAVESQFLHKNVQSALKLGMAKGMVLLAAERKKIPIFEYTPRKAKLSVVGTGSASKMQVQKMLQNILSLPHLPEPEDAADALALALCHANNRKVVCTRR